MSIEEIIDRIDTAGAWIVMKHLETDPRYKAILDEFYAFVTGFAGPDSSRQIRNPEMLAFLTSPRRITPFHFDAEINFLVQISGSKDLWVCDATDRSITTTEEIESYYSQSVTAGTWKPHAEERAQKFTLMPGDAVHIPTHASHWVRNHDSVSVSLSLNMEFPDSVHANVNKANRYLRRLGLRPRPPGDTPLLDAVKSTGFGALRSLRDVINGQGTV
jgi:hypothetical protein